MTSALTEGLSSTIQAQFEVLRQRFVDGLPARWLEIHDAVAPLALQGTLHRLSGSAGSYGFERLSQCAREAEALAISGPHVALAQALNLLETEIGRARSAVRDGRPPDSI